MTNNEANKPLTRDCWGGTNAGELTLTLLGHKPAQPCAVYNRQQQHKMQIEIIYSAF